MRLEQPFLETHEAWLKQTREIFCLLRLAYPAAEV
jgi:hypothetical protein